MAATTAGRTEFKVIPAAYGRYDRNSLAARSNHRTDRIDFSAISLGISRIFDVAASVNVTPVIDDGSADEIV